MLALSGLDLPNEASDLLQQLVFDMRSHCMERLLEQAISGQSYNLCLTFVFPFYIILSLCSLSPFHTFVFPYVYLSALFISLCEAR